MLDGRMMSMIMFSTSWLTCLSTSAIFNVEVNALLPAGRRVEQLQLTAKHCGKNAVTVYVPRAAARAVPIIPAPTIVRSNTSEGCTQRALAWFGVRLPCSRLVNVCIVSSWEQSLL